MTQASSSSRAALARRPRLALGALLLSAAAYSASPVLAAGNVVQGHPHGQLLTDAQGLAGRGSAAMQLLLAKRASDNDTNPGAVASAVALAGSDYPTAASSLVTATDGEDGTAIAATRSATSAAASATAASSSSRSVATPAPAAAFSLGDDPALLKQLGAMVDDALSALAFGGPKPGDSSSASGSAASVAQGTAGMSSEPAAVRPIDPSTASLTDTGGPAPTAAPEAPSSSISSSYTRTVPMGKRQESVPTLPTFSFDPFDPQATATASSDTTEASSTASMDPNQNPNMPDIGWLHTIVGGVPYRSGDLAASIVWILVTMSFIPLFFIRLLRRSSLISQVLFGILLFTLDFLAAMSLRAWLSNNNPRTLLIIIENILLSIMPPLLLEPLLALLGLYAKQGTVTTGVPTATSVLRFLNLLVLLLYALAAGYTATWLNDWQTVFAQSNSVGAVAELPNMNPPGIVRIGPIIGSFVGLITIAGGLLMIPVARGDNGSMRPGAYLAVLFVLLAIADVYRIVQTLHAQSAITDNGRDSNPFKFLASAAAQGLGPSAFEATFDRPKSLAIAASLTPPGMYDPSVSGINWALLQMTRASRNLPQTAVTFHIVYILPMWLLCFLFFFVHAPGKDEDESQAKVGPSVITTVMRNLA